MLTTLSVKLDPTRFSLLLRFTCLQGADRNAAHHVAKEQVQKGCASVVVRTHQWLGCAGLCWVYPNWQSDVKQLEEEEED
jgi:hypothetical protein